MEKLVVELMVDNMRPRLDPGPFGNPKNLSIQHYLVRLLHRVLTGIDNNSMSEVNAAVLMFIDFRQAYSRQCHTLGLQSFIKNGVRHSLIPILTSYFEGREMRVKWHGKLSAPQNLPGSGAMGSSLGNWEFLSQTNDSADCVPTEDRYKFVDDLTLVEIVNLMSIGISSFNTKQQVPNDIPAHGQFVLNTNLKCQKYLNNINTWAVDHKMIISKKKTKLLIINPSKQYQFTTRLALEGENIEVVDSMKILGTIINSKMTWDQNCEVIIKKVNARMQIIHKAITFGATKDELIKLWTTYCRNVLEQSCVVWHPHLTQHNIDDLERSQKSFTKLVLKEKYTNYQHALIKLNLQSLETRRNMLCETFAEKGIKNKTLNDLFPPKIHNHNMKIRKLNKYSVFPAKKERTKKSSIIYMQNLLNKKEN